MAKATHDIKKGEIRHPIKTPEALMKSSGPRVASEFRKDGTEIDLTMFFMTGEFPKYHYVVVVDIFESYTAPGHFFCVCHLITHSTEYDNSKVETSYLIDCKINTTTSYITRDFFIIATTDIEPNRVFGHVDLDKLEQALEH